MRLEVDRVPYEDVFPVNLRMLIAKRGITQKELAEEAGMTEAAISRYCNGKRVPNLVTAAALASALDCTVDQLMGREPIPSAMVT